MCFNLSKQLQFETCFAYINIRSFPQSAMQVGEHPPPPLPPTPRHIGYQQKHACPILTKTDFKVSWAPTQQLSRWMDADGAILISALQGCVWALKQNLPHGTDKSHINFNYFLYLKQFFLFWMIVLPYYLPHGRLPIRLWIPLRIFHGCQ
jgi:hypothetical protein